MRCARASTTTRELERQLDSRGLMNRFFGGYAKRIDTPWKMYPVGLLFGLGFDTATEVALLVLAGSAVVGGLPFYAVLSLPILFAAGMCLFDTLDGCFMNFAYDWAFAKPIRKIYYNLTITGLSVFVALFIGTIEILGLIAQEANAEWPVLGLHAELQHQPSGLRHRRDLRRHVDRGAGHLALWGDREEVGTPGRRGPRSGERGGRRLISAWNFEAPYRPLRHSSSTRTATRLPWVDDSLGPLHSGRMLPGTLSER